MVNFGIQPRKVVVVACILQVGMIKLQLVRSYIKLEFSVQYLMILRYIWLILKFGQF